MNASDVSDLLDFITSFDNRIVVTSERCKAWALALADGMDYEFAHSVIVAHYAKETSAIMPADFNALWKRDIDARATSVRALSIDAEYSFADRNKATPEQITYWKNYVVKAMEEAKEDALTEGRAISPFAEAFDDYINSVRIKTDTQTKNQKEKG